MVHAGIVSTVWCQPLATIPTGSNGLGLPLNMLESAGGIVIIFNKQQHYLLGEQVLSCTSDLSPALCQSQHDICSTLVQKSFEVALPSCGACRQ